MNLKKVAYYRTVGKSGAKLTLEQEAEYVVVRISEVKVTLNQLASYGIVGKSGAKMNFKQEV